MLIFADSYDPMYIYAFVQFIIITCMLSGLFTSKGRVPTYLPYVSRQLILFSLYFPYVFPNSLV